MEKGLRANKVFSDYIFLLPVFTFILSILLVRLHLFSMPLSNIYWTEAFDETILSDLFSYWKAIAVLFSASLSVLLMIIGLVRRQVNIEKRRVFIPIIIYVCAVLISYIFSSYRYFALRGMQEHFEGTLVLLAYIIMLSYLISILNNEGQIKAVIVCVLVVAFLLGILGIFQSVGKDFFMTTLGQKIITPNNVSSNGIHNWDMIDILASQGETAYNFTFTEGQVYQTVYNINYVPLYLSLIIPITAVLFIYFEEKSRKAAAVVMLVLFATFVYNFFAANSASGYLGLLAIVIGAIVIFRRDLRAWIKQLICLFLIGGLIMGITANQWIPQIQQFLTKASQEMIVNVYAEDIPDVNYEYQNEAAGVWLPIDYIETFDDYVDFGINNNILRVTRDNEHSAFLITDGEGNHLFVSAIVGEDAYQILDERFHDYIKLTVTNDGNNPYVVVSTVSYDWRFAYVDDAFYFRNNQGKLTTLNNIPHAGIFSNYRFGSNRGRIWDTTIPLFKQFLVKGAGADCYTFVYPQNDYVTVYNKYNANWFNVVTDKAHNIYMTYWVNTGLISLLAWLAIVGDYLLGAVKQFKKRGFANFCDFVNGGIFCGILGFLVVAFFNDGSLSTMPMFYTMLGTGLAINMRAKFLVSESASSDS